jgi:2-polyprenyl-6-methoxyphenol hydroxylase-like FAD-dependent oxidoreductase
MRLRVLVSGASIAGNTAAWWLTQFGHHVTVVEEAPSFRDGGQNIDVRGVGREVLRRMGLDDAALASGTTEEGTAWVNEDGSVAAQMVTEDLGGDGPTAELEILRGDLARLIYEPASTRATYRFGDTIKSIVNEREGVQVGFASGNEGNFDLVVVAEGVGSATRELVFPRENDPRWMDVTMAYFTIPRIDDDDHMWRWYNATEGRSISLRPDNRGTIRANLTIQQPPQGEQGWDEQLQKVYMRDRFADAGWQAERVLAGMEETDDFYFDVLRQVRMPKWSKGRVVLVGDAAWCATPLAGIGTTLAITGAYVLAGELCRHQNVSGALDAFEEAMRPMVEEGQGVPKVGPKMMNPHSRLGIHLLHGVLNIASKPAVRGIASKLFTREPKTPDLSAYPHALQTASS